MLDPPLRHLAAPHSLYGKATALHATQQNVLTCHSAANASQNPWTPSGLNGAQLATVKQSSASCVGRRCHRRRSNRTPKASQASQESRNHHLQENIPASRLHLPRTTGMSDLWHLHSVDDIGLPCRNPQHLTLTRQFFSRFTIAHVLPPRKRLLSSRTPSNRHVDTNVLN